MSAQIRVWTEATELSIVCLVQVRSPPGPLPCSEPEQAVVVAHAVDDVGQAVAVDVAREDLDAGRPELPVGVPGPGVVGSGSAGASNQPLGVSRSMRPSPLTSPEPTPCPAAWAAEVVLLELEALAVALLDDLVPDDHVDRVGQDVGHAVAGQVDHPRPPRCCPAGRPRDRSRACPTFPGFSTQPTFLTEIRACDEIGMAVAVDVERQGGEVVVVRADPLATSRTW